MCGIVGICGKQEESWISAMNDIQAHRGPDGEGIFRSREDDVAIANRRLAIIDLSTGQQPMTTQDGRFTIVFNGEIFNAPELRLQLEKEGVEFMTDHSDTEVVLQGYVRQGKSFVKKLDGMFAFAIYDQERSTLCLARDHAGIKPLYYFYRNGRFAFASELKSLLKLPFIKREINSQSLWHYVSLKYIPGEETILENIKRLPPAHTLTYDLQKQTIQQDFFWKPVFGQGSMRSLSEWVKILREELEASVLRWTLSDVTIACSLSGGLDSSSIVGLLAKSGQKLKTFSLGFSGEEEAYWNELPRAKQVAHMWNTDHHELVMDPEKLLDDLISMVWHLDEPYAGGLPSWMIFQFMAKEVKVGLTGVGGDEMFGNYGKWRGNFPWFGFDFEKDFFEKFYYLSDKKKNITMSLSPGNQMQSTSHFLKTYFDAADAATIRDRVAATDILTQLPEEFLMMTDRFSMAHSLEARTPFLDKKFMELALSVPSKIRTKRFDLKYLLRRVVADVLPRELLHARKKGFVLPLPLWLRGKLRPLVMYFLNRDYLKKQEIFQPEVYERYVVPHLEGRADFHHQIWIFLMFQIWHHVFMKGNSVDKPTYGWKDIIS